MLMLSILIVPLLGIFTIATNLLINDVGTKQNKNAVKYVGLFTSLVNLVISLVIFILFNFSDNQFQFVQEHYNMSGYNIYFGIDGLSVYFMLLTTIIMPIAILSNWVSIKDEVKWYIMTILLLETLLLGVFLILDTLVFYISFESILAPLFLLIGIFGSTDKVRASFYLFLYTLLGSLFLLLSILAMNSIMGFTDYYMLFKSNFLYFFQLILFIGIFIAFAVKTPTIFLNTWLLKAHVESPLGGSIILAGIVLKLSLYGIFRLILPILPKAALSFTYIVYFIGVITILYASVSTLRTVDVKELIAYSSVSHAAVYLMGVFSNTLQGIGGGIILGLAHGFVSSGLFICTGGVLYDRSSTRLITYYRGMTQIMPLFSILFFILCLSNAGTPLSLNFIGEFLSLYGSFERLPMLGVFASTSIVLSAAYTIYMFNRISFGGKLSNYLLISMPDLNKREFIILLTLVLFTVILGIYPAVIIDGINFSISTLIYACAPTNTSNLYADSLLYINNLFSVVPSLQSIYNKTNTVNIELSHDNLMFYMFIFIIFSTYAAIFALKKLNNLKYNYYLYTKNPFDISFIRTALIFMFCVYILFNNVNIHILAELININNFHLTQIKSHVQNLVFENVLFTSPDTSSNIQESGNDQPSDNGSNNNQPGDNDDDESEENRKAKQEGLEANRLQEEKLGRCLHRSGEVVSVSYGDDMENKIDCDYCKEKIMDDFSTCNNCNAIICNTCNTASIHIQSTEDLSDHDGNESDT